MVYFFIENILIVYFVCFEQQKGTKEHS